MNLKRFASGACLLGLVALATAVNAHEGDGAYKIDPVHSGVVFRIKHLDVAYFYGRFNKIEGDFTINWDAPEKSEVSIVVDAASVDTNNEKRDQHLRSPDFFNVKQFPQITFKSKKVSRDDDELEIVGDLTLHGVTKQITVEAEYVGSGKDPWGGQRTGYELKFKVKRSDFGMNYMQDALGDEVEVIVSVEATKK